MLETTSLITIFLTGLTTGGLTCLALQGSLLASLGANNKLSIKPTLTFLGSKLVIHTLFGFLLGLIGTNIKLTPIQQGYFQVFLGIYLLGIAGNILNLHPLFRYFVLTPPKFVLRFARKLSRDNQESSQTLTAATLGAATIFLPCATTQAIEVLALSTGSPIYSAMMLFFFTLGTIPSFLLFGGLINKGQSSLQKHFPKILGTALFLMSIYTINSGVALTGSVYTIQNFYDVATKKNLEGGTAVLGESSQTATLNVTNQGYSPRNITLKRDVPVTLSIKTTNVSNCARSFTIPNLNIDKLLPKTGTTTIEFTPKETGPLAFSCSMGMYTGNFNVVN